MPPSDTSVNKFKRRDLAQICVNRIFNFYSRSGHICSRSGYYWANIKSTSQPRWEYRIKINCILANWNTLLLNTIRLNACKVIFFTYYFLFFTYLRKGKVESRVYLYIFFLFSIFIYKHIHIRTFLYTHCNLTSRYMIACVMGTR